MVASLGRRGRKRRRREKIRQKEGDNEGEEGGENYEVGKRPAIRALRMQAVLGPSVA
jgi:hypothetical protein